MLEDASDRIVQGGLDEVLLGRIPSFAEHEVFLCGDPNLVQRLKRSVFLAGARLAAIHADPFIVAPVPAAGEPAAAAM